LSGWFAPFPREQLFDAINRMVGDAGDDVGEPSLRIDVVHFCGFNERVHDGGAPAARVGTCEEIVLAAESERTNGAFGGIVRHFEPAVVDVSGQGDPTRGGVANGDRERTLAADFGERRFKRTM